MRLPISRKTRFKSGLLIEATLPVTLQMRFGPLQFSNPGTCTIKNSESWYGDHKNACAISLFGLLRLQF